MIIFCTLLIGCAGQNGTNGVNGLDGSPGLDGKDGYSCTVEDTDEGALITCEDGSSEEIEDGEDLPSPTPVPSPVPNACIQYKECKYVSHGHKKCKTKRVCWFKK